jgi:hypothetical protein
VGKVSSGRFINSWITSAEVPDAQAKFFHAALKNIPLDILLSMSNTEIETSLARKYANFDPDEDVGGFEGLGSLFGDPKPPPTAESEYGDYSYSIPWIDSLMETFSSVQPFSKVRPLNFNEYQMLQIITGTDTPEIQKKVFSYYCPKCRAEKKIKYSMGTRYNEDAEEYLKPLFNTGKGVESAYYFCDTCYDNADGFAGLGSLFG